MSNNSYNYKKKILDENKLISEDSNPIFENIITNNHVILRRNLLLNSQNISQPSITQQKFDLTNRTTVYSFSQSKIIDSGKKKSKKKIKLNTIKNPVYQNNIINILKKPGNRRKYNIIIDNHPLCPINFNGLPNSVIKLNEKYKNHLIKTNSDIFDSPFPLVSKEKFSPKFQNLEHFDKNEKFIKESNYSFDAIKIFSMNKFKTEGNVKKDDTTYKKMLRLKLKQIILKAAIHFKRCDLSLEEIYNESINGRTYYEKNQILNYLIKAIKQKNIPLILQILSDYKQSVLLFDLYNQTPLHWICKRNIYKLIPKFLSYGADIDSIDYSGYTPLHISIIKNNFESFIILNLYGASPFVKDNFGNKPIDYCKDYKFSIVLKKSSIIHIGRLFGKVKFFFEDLQRTLSSFIESELKYELEKDCLEMVKEVYNKSKINN